MHASKQKIDGTIQFIYFVLRNYLAWHGDQGRE